LTLDLKHVNISRLKYPHRPLSHSQAHQLLQILILRTVKVLDILSSRIHPMSHLLEPHHQEFPEDLPIPPIQQDIYAPKIGFAKARSVTRVITPGDVRNLILSGKSNRVAYATFQ
jgi:hypothetical protein